MLGEPAPSCPRPRRGPRRWFPAQASSRPGRWGCTRPPRSQLQPSKCSASGLRGARGGCVAAPVDGEPALGSASSVCSNRRHRRGEAPPSGTCRSPGPAPRPGASGRVRQGARGCGPAGPAAPPPAGRAVNCGPAAPALPASGRCRGPGLKKYTDCHLFNLLFFCPFVSWAHVLSVFPMCVAQPFVYNVSCA